MSNEDYFADVRNSGDLAGFGVFDGEGIKDHNSAPVKRSPNNDGMIYTIKCGNCGAPHNITVSWLEFIYGGHGHIPIDPETKRPWKHEQQFGGFHPNMGCKQCSNALLFIITPDECARHLKAAQAAGAITPQQIAAVASQLRQQAAAYRR